MNITEKIDEYLNEKSEIPKGLLQWVEDYKEARKGNVKLAKKLKADIDKEIKKLKLNRKEVYGDLSNFFSLTL
jgi:hypothetical protein